jgi:hypothetical protein
VPLRVGRDVTALIPVLARTMDPLGEPELDTAAGAATAVGRELGIEPEVTRRTHGGPNPHVGSPAAVCDPTAQPDPG